MKFNDTYYPVLYKNNELTLNQLAGTCVGIAWIVSSSVPRALPVLNRYTKIRKQRKTQRKRRTRACGTSVLHAFNRHKWPSFPAPVASPRSADTCPKYIRVCAHVADYKHIRAHTKKPVFGPFGAQIWKSHFPEEIKFARSKRNVKCTKSGRLIRFRARVSAMNIISRSRRAAITRRSTLSASIRARRHSRVVRRSSPTCAFVPEPTGGRNLCGDNRGCPSTARKRRLPKTIANRWNVFIVNLVYDFARHTHRLTHFRAGASKSKHNRGNNVLPINLPYSRTPMANIGYNFVRGGAMRPSLPLSAHCFLFCSFFFF